MQLTIQRDTSEQRPLAFPSRIRARGPSGVGIWIDLLIEDVSLVTGDYTVKGYHHLTLVERKCGILEIGKNILSPDCHRLEREFVRLRDECRYPILFIEGSLASFLNPPRPKRPRRDGQGRTVQDTDMAFSPEEAVFGLFTLCRQYGIMPMICPVTGVDQKRKAGVCVALLLAAGVLAHAS